MTKINNLVFDWSGVISDDLMQTYTTVMAIFDHYHVPRISLDVFREDFDIPPVILYRKHGIENPMAEIDGLYNQFWPNFSQVAPPMFPDASKVLHELKNRGFWLALVSSHPVHLLKQEVIDNGFKDVFPVVRGFCRDKVACLETLLAEYSLSKMETLYIGDMKVDIESGKKVGIKTGGLGTGYQSPHILELANPDYYFNSLTDLLERVDVL